MTFQKSPYDQLVDEKYANRQIGSFAHRNPVKFKYIFSNHLPYALCPVFCQTDRPISVGEFVNPPGNRVWEKDIQQKSFVRSRKQNSEDFLKSEGKYFCFFVGGRVIEVHSQN